MCYWKSETERPIWIGLSSRPHTWKICLSYDLNFILSSQVPVLYAYGAWRRNPLLTPTVLQTPPYRVMSLLWPESWKVMRKRHASTTRTENAGRNEYGPWIGKRNFFDPKSNSPKQKWWLHDLPGTKWSIYWRYSVKSRFYLKRNHIVNNVSFINGPTNQEALSNQETLVSGWISPKC